MVPSVEAALANQQLAVRVSILYMLDSAQTQLKEKEPKSKHHCSRKLTLHNFFVGKTSASSLPKPLSATISLLFISKDGSPYYIGIGMVPSIIDVWGYDREFCSSSSSSSSSPSSSSSSSTNVTQKLK